MNYNYKGSDDDVIPCSQPPRPKRKFVRRGKGDESDKNLGAAVEKSPINNLEVELQRSMSNLLIAALQPSEPEPTKNIQRNGKFIYFYILTNYFF